MAEKPYHHGDLRRTLIDSAIEMLREGNVDDISLRELAKRVGVSPNAPYRHFKDKESLLAAAAEKGFRELTARFRAVDSTDPEAWYLGLGRAYFEFSKDRPAEFKVMFGRMGNFSEHSHLVEASGEAFFILLSAIRALSPEGTTQTQAVPMALTTWSTIHGYATLQQQNAFDFIDESVIPTPEQAFGELLRAMRSR
jgi:AcrR family transcriptional regulator